MSKPKTKKTQGLDLVMMRNAFYYDGFRRIACALIVLLVIDCVLAGLVIYQWAHPPQPQYFATRADGRIINIHPLNDPTVPDDFVLQWVVSAVIKSFSLDYVHWRSQLQESVSNFTPSGWHWFLSSLKSTNNLKTLVNLKMVSNATVTGSPRIVQKAIVDGHYAWKIIMPLLVTYTNGKDNTIHQPMNVTLIVIRMPVQQNPQRIAINNFIAETVNANAYGQ